MAVFIYFFWAPLGSFVGDVNSSPQLLLPASGRVLIETKDSCVKMFGWSLTGNFSPGGVDFIS